MRWFKHFTDNHRGRTVQRLLDEMGPHGALAYYFVMEMCAEKLEKKHGSILSENDCVFVFNRKVIQNVTRMKRVSTDNLGIIGAECGVWEWKSIGNEIIIKMPILLDLLDRDLKGARSRRAQDAQKPRLELDIESDKELDIESELLPKPKKSIKQNSELNKKIWESYRDAYSARYGVDPVRNGSVNSKIDSLGKRLGEKAPEIIKFYVFHNDSFYVKNAHSIGLALAQAESLATQWKTGKPITQTEVRRFEKASAFDSMAKEAEKGGF